MDNTPPPPSSGQQNQPPDNTPQGAETERIIIEPSSTPEYTPPSGQPYTGQPEYTGQPQNYPPAQPTVPMGGPPPGYQHPPQQVGVPPQPQGYAPPPSTPQYQQPYQQPYPPQGQTTTVTQKKGGMPAWAWVLIGLFVALILACGVIYFVIVRAVDEGTKAIVGAGDTIGASFAVLGYDIALQTNQYEDAQNYLGGDLASRYSVDELQERWEALSVDGMVTTEISDVKMSGNRPQVIWSLPPHGGTKTDVTLTLEPSGEDRKIVEASPDLIPSP